jgi:hypothetical protein
LGCSGTPSNAPGCVQGLSSSCLCADGSHGAQVCQPDNTFGACTCALSAPLGGGAVPGPSGTGTAGSGGGVGTGPSGTGGFGGSSGMGSGGAAGRVGGMAGQPSGSAGMGDQAPGSPYSFCNMSSPCAAGATCTSPSGGYCSPPCTLALQCPRPSGGGRASCVAGTCAISGCDQLKCPRNTTCVQTPMMPAPSAQTSFSCK